LYEGIIQPKIQKALEHLCNMSDDAWSNLDKVDQKIIEILNNNARTPSKEIASELTRSGHDVSGNIFEIISQSNLILFITKKCFTPKK